MEKPSLGPYHHQQQMPGSGPAPTSSLTANNQRWPLFAPPYQHAQNAHSQHDDVDAGTVSTMNHLTKLAAKLVKPFIAFPSHYGRLPPSEDLPHMMDTTYQVGAAQPSGFPGVAVSSPQHQQQQQIVASYHHQHSQIQHSMGAYSTTVKRNTMLGTSRLNPLAPEFSLKHPASKYKQQSNVLPASANFHQKSNVLLSPLPPSSFQSSGLATILPKISFSMKKSSLGPYHHQQQMPGPGPAPTSSLTANHQRWPLFAPPYQHAQNAHSQHDDVGAGTVSTMNHLTKLAAKLVKPFIAFPSHYGRLPPSEDLPHVRDTTYQVGAAQPSGFPGVAVSSPQHQQQQQIVASYHHQHSQIQHSMGAYSTTVKRNTMLGTSRLNPLAPEFSLKHPASKYKQQSNVLPASANFHQKSNVLLSPLPPSSFQSSGLATILPKISFSMKKSSLGPYHHQQQMPGPGPAPTSSLTANHQRWPLFAPPYQHAQNAHSQHDDVGAGTVSTMNHLTKLAAKLVKPFIAFPSHYGRLPPSEDLPHVRDATYQPGHLESHHSFHNGGTATMSLHHGLRLLPHYNTTAVMVAPKSEKMEAPCWDTASRLGMADVPDKQNVSHLL